MRTGLTGGRLGKQVSEVNRKKKREREGGKKRKRSRQTAKRTETDRPTNTHTLHTCSSLFPNTQRKNRARQAHTDKHQPELV